MECKQCGETDRSKLEFDASLNHVLCAACTYNNELEEEMGYMFENDIDDWEPDDDEEEAPYWELPSYYR